MNNAIRMEVLRRRITRLCHFTPSRNLLHIMANGDGLLASQHLEDDEKAVFNPTDVRRFDGYPDHICCSVQYPNARYFRKARSDSRLFRDWVVLFIDRHHLWVAGTKFCHTNAATKRGKHVDEGLDAFQAMFAPSTVGANNRQSVRAEAHPEFLPTDEQAEVLIPDRIGREDILGIGVFDEAQAKREVVRMQTIGASSVPRIVVVPDFFDAGRLSRGLRTGFLPAEVEHEGD